MNDMIFKSLKRKTSTGRVAQCCTALNQSELLRAKVSWKSEVGLRFRDLTVSGHRCDLITYWGAWRDEKLSPAAFELLHLLDCIRRIISVELSIEAIVQIVYTDTHAKLNGVSSNVIERYEESLKAALPANFQVTLMSSLQPISATYYSAALADTSPISGAWSRLNQQLQSQALSLFSEQDAIGRASTYLQANLNEAPKVFEAWPHGIFLHTGLPELRPMLPSMPIIYSYTGKHRATRKPWFAEKCAEG